MVVIGYVWEKIADHYLKLDRWLADDEEFVWRCSGLAR
jgi:hypothetical protein